MVSINFSADAAVKLIWYLGPQKTLAVLRRELQFTKFKNNKTSKILK